MSAFSFHPRFFVFLVLRMVLGKMVCQTIDAYVTSWHQTCIFVPSSFSFFQGIFICHSGWLWFAFWFRKWCARIKMAKQILVQVVATSSGRNETQNFEGLTYATKRNQLQPQRLKHRRLKFNHATVDGQPLPTTGLVVNANGRKCSQVAASGCRCLQMVGSAAPPEGTNE